MTDDAEPLSAEFEVPSREAWLKLVDKALKGGSFERQLVSHSADGLRIEPLGTQGSMSTGVGAATKPDPKLCNAAIREDLDGGVNSLLLQIEAPGQSGLGYGAEPLATALSGVRL